MSQSLPPTFAELERFVEKWDKPNSNSRYAERLASQFPELLDFHDAVLRRIHDIKEYLSSKGFLDYSPEDIRLAHLAFAWVPVAEAVEVFKQPRVPDSKGVWDVHAEYEL
jgi:hypothetical protein